MKGVRLRREPVLTYAFGPDELLWSEDNASGVHLEDLLEQLLDELRCRRSREVGEVGAREGSLVITKLEEAVLWRRRELEVQDRAEWRRARPEAVPL